MKSLATRLLAIASFSLALTTSAAAAPCVSGPFNTLAGQSCDAGAATFLFDHIYTGVLNNLRPEPSESNLWISFDTTNPFRPVLTFQGDFGAEPADPTGGVSLQFGTLFYRVTPAAGLGITGLETELFGAGYLGTGDYLAVASTSISTSYCPDSGAYSTAKCDLAKAVVSEDQTIPQNASSVKMSNQLITAYATTILEAKAPEGGFATYRSANIAFELAAVDAPEPASLCPASAALLLMGLAWMKRRR